MQKRRTYRNEIPSRESVTKYREYWELVNWFATPAPARNPKSVAELAKVLSLHRTTLQRWENVEGFYEDIWKIVGKEMGKEMSTIVQALKNRIFKDGNPKAVEMFINWARDISPTIVVKHEGKLDITDPKTKDILDKVNQLTKELL